LISPQRSQVLDVSGALNSVFLHVDR
jgi:hypothetical protein